MIPERDRVALRPEQATIPPEHGWNRLPVIAAASAAVGIAACGILGAANPKQFFFSWLVSFLFFLSLALGALFFVLIVNTIASLQIFTEVYTMYFGRMASGAGSEAALFYVIYLFRQAFEFLNMGYASAMAWLLFVIIMVLNSIANLMRGKGSR